MNEYGKGDIPRPMRVSEEEYAENWCRAFKHSWSQWYHWETEEGCLLRKRQCKNCGQREFADDGM